VKRSLMLGSEPCELEREESLAVLPFSGSNRRERGEDQLLVKIARNICSGGESGEKRERSKAGLGGGTAIDRCSLNLDGEP